MDKTALETLLAHLIARWEGEVVEFKQAGKDYDTDKIGRYFSAMANEANLRSEDGAWLVFGVILRAADMAHIEEVEAAAGVIQAGQPVISKALKKAVCDISGTRS